VSRTVVPTNAAQIHKKMTDPRPEWECSHKLNPAMQRAPSFSPVYLWVCNAAGNERNISAVADVIDKRESPKVCNETEEKDEVAR